MRLLIVGNRGGTNVGGCFERAAAELSLHVCLVESRRAMDAPAIIRRFNWWFRGKRPTRLDQFSQEILEICRQWRPQCLVSTGTAPLNAHALHGLGLLGIRRVNYLTDDPWNTSLRAPWFLDALLHYDVVFSPRRSNETDLAALGCSEVRYLPFAFAPELHFPDPPSTSDEQARFASDVLFVGGAERERVPFIAGLIQAGFQVALYGDNWERFTETRGYTRGHADTQLLRKATGGAKVALCLVRRGNRDGHVMRSFEIPAIGAAMLAEETEEHRAIFGRDGEKVVYFRTVGDMIEKLRWLLDHDRERRRLAAAAHAHVVNGCNTYKDRLITMLELDNGQVTIDDRQQTIEYGCGL